MLVSLLKARGLFAPSRARTPPLFYLKKRRMVKTTNKTAVTPDEMSPLAEALQPLQLKDLKDEVMTHNLALNGFGTVGQGLAEILRDKGQELRTRYGFEAQLVAITTASRGALHHPHGLDISYLRHRPPGRSNPGRSRGGPAGDGLRIAGRFAGHTPNPSKRSELRVHSASRSGGPAIGTSDQHIIRKGGFAPFAVVQIPPL